jgi:phasin family protein
MPERKKQDDFAEKAYAAAAAEMKSASKSRAKTLSKSKKSGQAKPVAAAKSPVEKKKAPIAEEALSLPPLRTKAPATEPAPAEEAKQPLPPVEAKAPATQAAAVEPHAPITPPAPAQVAEAPAITAPQPTTPDLKDTIMASAPKSNDNVKQINDTMNNTMTTAISEIQTRAKAAYDKGTETAGEVTEFAKGNVEAVVESTKIFAAGVQDLGRSYVEEVRSAYETMTADVKELAAVKSPTELFQLQGKIVRRNFDAMIATSSKNTEAFMKLASEAFAPLSGRVNLATEKFSKVA